MKTSAILLSCILAFMWVCNAQNTGLNNNWLMGYQAAAGPPGGQSRINFFSGSAVISYDSIWMDFNHTHANISDTAGNMLFYTNGHDIANANDNLMQNGAGLSPGAYANAFPDGFLIPQGALILPKPNSSNIYYLFHCSVDNYPDPTGSVSLYLRKTEIDMNIFGGYGGVTVKNQIILNDSLNVGKFSACRHGNGRDWWLLIHRVKSNKFYKLLITPNGVGGIYTQNIGSIRDRFDGQAKFSPNGKRYALLDYDNAGIDIYDFDRCTGDLSNWRHDTLSTPYGNIGCAFSGNSDVFYVSNIFKVYQYDCTTANLSASRLTVAAYDSFVDPQNFQGTYLCLPELAPDGKIYITTGNSTQFMHVINYPDSVGLSCDVVQHGVYLPAIYFNTLPNHPNYFLGRDSGSVCDTITVWMGSPPAPQMGVFKIQALPNPSDGVFTLWFPVNKDVGWLEIYDVDGKLILKEPVAQWSQYKQVDISPLTSKGGIFFCRMIWKDGEGSVKVVKAP